MTDDITDDAHEEFSPKWLESSETDSNPIPLVQIGHAFSDRSPVLVREIPSRGLSFQLWPAAISLCKFLELSFRNHLHRQEIELERKKFQDVDESAANVAVINFKTQSNDSSSILNLIETSAQLPSSSPRELSLKPPLLDQSKSASKFPTEPESLTQNTPKPKTPSQTDSRHDPREITATGSTSFCMDLRGKKVLELGAGTGLAGMAAARFGATVALTDLPAVMANLEENIKLNEADIRSSGGSVKCQVLTWGDPDDVVKIGKDFDFILGADIVYYDTLFEPLLKTLAWLCSPPDGQGGQDKAEFGGATGQGKSRTGQCDCALPLRSGEDAGNGAFVTGVKSPLVILSHLRRWKKDSKFFRAAAKNFVVRKVFEDDAKDGARKGVEIYSLQQKY